MKLFSRSNKKSAENQPIIVVSGLPRSGTSMMMRMLAEGGLPILTDELRRADDDNPKGYFELEVVRQLKEGNFAWLKESNGKVVKVISALLEYLPKEYQYKIIFMERDPKETLASQKKMLDHRGETSKLSDEAMEQQFHTHLAAMKPWLVRQPNMEVFYVNYNALMAEPGSFCEQIAEFLGLPLNEAQMLAIPDKQLYRNRTTEK
jgi:Sulfotransferase family